MKSGDKWGSMLGMEPIKLEGGLVPAFIKYVWNYFTLMVKISTIKTVVPKAKF